YNLGVMYEKGKGVKQDHKKAVEWFRLAAAQELARAVEKLNLLSREKVKKKLKKDSEVFTENFNGLTAKKFQEGLHAFNKKDYEAAQQLFLQLAEQGVAKAQYNLALMYSKAEGTQRNYEEAVKWYRRAAEKGFAKAQTNLGWMYEKGKGVPRDNLEAIRWYKLAADQGLAKAQEKLNLLSKEKTRENSGGFSKSTANSFQDGLNAFNNKDYKTAHQLFSQLAEQGVAEAQYNLGLMYGKGKGVQRDYSEAIKWWKLAADRGVGKAQTNLAWMHEKGKGILQDNQEAIRWYRLAAEQGLAKAQEKLNLLLKDKNLENIKGNATNPKGSPLDIVSKEVPYRGTAFDGARYSEETFIGVRDGPNAFDRFHAALNSLDKENFKIAYQSFRELADQGFAEAQINLGMMFEKGKGVSQDYKEAVRWYQLAADQGLTKAQEKLKLLLNDKARENTQENIQEKTQENIQENTQENSMGSDAITSRRISGSGHDNLSASDRFYTALDAFNKEEFNIAYQLFLELSDQGFAEAQVNLGLMYEKGKGTPQDYKEAVKLYQLAADQGLIKAQYNLGLMYANGYGVAKNPMEAIKWYRLAAEQGLIKAQTTLGFIYEKGDGVAQNYQKAAKWHKLAAEQGDADAQYKSGLIYANGKGVEPDYKEAIKWYKLSAEQGNALAKGELDILLSKKGL
ncbi:MAG: SEL1-like repeat protein, partial [Nitrospinota bacterium]|nr:SEL1-like repeat protein [Nitrospinota bacterium]